MIRPQFILDLNDEIVVDNFAGGGGASIAIEMALGRHVDEAINHNWEATAMHQANHPQTRHHCEDIFKVSIDKVTRGRPVGLAWFSPDCKHFSKAKGGKPRSKKIRGLAWVVIKWAKHPTAKPRVIILENVEEFQGWGPLLKSGEVCPKRKGRTFKYWVKRLRNLGYQVEWRELRACDYGAPTIRKRLYLIARCDGKPIIWPEPTHADPDSEGFALRKLKPWRTAAECIDWTLPCYSIFLTKKEAKRMGARVNRPLKEATMRRVARGVFKFVINAKEPFIINLTLQGGDRNEPVSEPFRTITGANRGEKALAIPWLTEHANASTKRSFDPLEPMRTQCAEVKGGHFALVSAFLAKHYGGVTGTDLRDGIGTITGVDHHSLVAANLVKYHGNHKGRKDGNSRGQTMGEPLRSLDTSNRFGLIASHLTKFYGTNTGSEQTKPMPSVTADGQHIGEVRAFLMKYYGEGGQDQPLNEPIHTIPTLDRFGLVMVRGQLYSIADILMRMLSPRELYRGQGFPENYRIQIELDVIRHGKIKRVKLSKEAQVRMCGNSVSPPVAAALVSANVPELAVWRNGERKAFQKYLRTLQPPSPFSLLSPVKSQIP